MKNFIKKKEAINLLEDLSNSKLLDDQTRISLLSIKTCLLGEKCGFNLWGKSAQGVKAYFEHMEEPDSNEVWQMQNYENFKIAKENAKRYLESEVCE